MFNLKVVQHALISKKDLDDIIYIKTISWPYSYKEQLTWINKNIKNSDLHILLYENKDIIAYLNLIDIELVINYKLKIAFGVGNVCTLEKEKGFGSELMDKANNFLIENNRVGLLFCKKKLVSFYKKNGWFEVDKMKLILSFNNCINETMIFNQLDPLIKLQYNGNSF